MGRPFIHEPFNFTELEDITSEDGKRLYIVPESVHTDGKRTLYHSVTTILGSLPKPDLDAWKVRKGPEEANKVMKQAGSKGKGVHKLAELFMLDSPDYDKAYRDAMPTVLASWKKLIPILEKNVTKVYNNEFCLWSSRLKTAGRCDLLADWKGSPAIVDFKTSNKPKSLEWISNYIYQTVCYSMMVKERVGLIVPKVVILITVPELLEPQVFIQDVSDYYETVFKIFNNFKGGKIDTHH